MLAAILLSGFSAMAKAKGDMAVGGGLEVSLPMDSDFQNFAGTGFGVTAQFNYVYSEKITLLGTAGYIKWAGEDYGYYSYAYSEIPLKAGAKYFLTENVYGLAELGMHMYKFSMDYNGPDNYGYSFGSSSSSNTEIGIAIGVGYEYPINDKISLDGSVRYEMNALGYVGIRLGANYAIGK